MNRTNLIRLVLLQEMQRLFLLKWWEFFFQLTELWLGPKKMRCSNSEWTPCSATCIRNDTPMTRLLELTYTAFVWDLQISTIATLYARLRLVFFLHRPFPIRSFHPFPYLEIFYHIISISQICFFTYCANRFRSLTSIDSESFAFFFLILDAKFSVDQKISRNFIVTKLRNRLTCEVSAVMVGSCGLIGN